MPPLCHVTPLHYPIHGYDLYGAGEEHASHDRHVALACVHLRVPCAPCAGRSVGKTDLEDEELRRGSRRSQAERPQPPGVPAPGVCHRPGAARSQLLLQPGGSARRMALQVTGLRRAASALLRVWSPLAGPQTAPRDPAWRRWVRLPSGSGCGACFHEARSQRSPRGVLGGVTQRRTALQAGSWLRLGVPAPPRSAGCPRAQY